MAGGNRTNGTRYFKILDSMDKKDALIIYGGKDIARLEKSLPNLTEGNDYEKMKAKLSNHFILKQNKHIMVGVNF